VELLTNKLKIKLHMLKTATWRWPTVKEKTCQSTN